MKRRTFLGLHDCPDLTGVLVEMTVGGVEEGMGWMSLAPTYRLVWHPSKCFCGARVGHVDPSQAALRAAWDHESAEDV